MLNTDFFNRDTLLVAKELLGKVIYKRYGTIWLTAMIVETEAYYLADKGSHASLGRTAKRQALFMPAGTIYMYYARGGDSLNISCQGDGNAVLIKSAYPYIERNSLPKMISIMQKLNPLSENKQRTVEQLCKGQTLLCKSLGLKVPDWDQQQFDKNKFYIDDIGLIADKIVQTKRLGIPKGRDEHLLYRFIDYNKIKLCTSNPLTKKCFASNKDYFILEKC